MSKNKITSYLELETYFIKEVSKRIKHLNKNVVYWQEVYDIASDNQVFQN
jgi:hypothetical protein